MEENIKEKLIEDIALEILKKSKIKNNNFSIPIGVSNKHVHLTEEDFQYLFGYGKTLTFKASVRQPGYFAAEETVTLVGTKGVIEKVRILGPLRNYSQVEISRTDAFTLGVKPPVRDSGDLKGSETLCIVGPRGMLYFENKIICARRHIHMNPIESEEYGVKDGDLVEVETQGEKAVILKNVTIKIGKDYVKEMHIDTDEANGSEVKSNDLVRIIGKQR